MRALACSRPASETNRVLQVLDQSHVVVRVYKIEIDLNICLKDA